MDVSLIVPFYKGNAYMERIFALARSNAANAPGVQLELLIVCDSPDCPVEYAPSWVEGFSLRILENEKNMGIIAYSSADDFSDCMWICWFNE